MNQITLSHTSFLDAFCCPAASVKLGDACRLMSHGSLPGGHQASRDDSLLPPCQCPRKHTLRKHTQTGKLLELVHLTGLSARRSCNAARARQITQFLPRKSIIIWKTRRGNITLEALRSALLIDMAISLLFLAVFEQNCCCKNEKYVDAHNTECRSEDRIQEVICILRKRRDTTDHRCSNLGVWTGSINDELRRSAVHVATTVELSYVSMF